MTGQKSVVVCVTGASGAVYASRVVKALALAGTDVCLVFSANGKQVFEYELKTTVDQFVREVSAPGKPVAVVDNNDFFSPLASGGSSFDVLVCPCSMGTLGRLASGVSANLIERLCDVALKERRRLVCVVRESPLNLIHLRNMVALAEAGAVIMPASPFFYLEHNGLDDILDQFSDRILKMLVDGYPVKDTWRGNGGL